MVKVALPVLQLDYNTGSSFLPHAVEGSRLIATDTRIDYSARSTSGPLVRRRRSHHEPRSPPEPPHLTVMVSEES